MIEFKSITKGYNKDLDITYYKVEFDNTRYIIFVKLKNCNELLLHKRNVDIDLTTWDYLEYVINTMENKGLL
jgi:hypothetical protein